MKRGDVFVEGSEQSGSRPVIVVSRDAINRSSPVVIAVPCTSWSSGRNLYPSQVRIAAPEGGLRSDSIALGEQIRAITKDRLSERWGAVRPDTMHRLERALQIALDLPGQFD